LQSSVQSDLVSPVVVVAHDAGGANLIIGWLRGACNIDVRACLAGPAAGLWANAFGRAANWPLVDALRGARTLLSGTSYASSLEHEGRSRARAAGIRSIGVIDHWVNYPDRFIRDGVQVLPDEIWVTDEYALAIAGSCFGGLMVRQQPNCYLTDLVKQIRAVEEKTKCDNRVLYVLEPVRQSWAEGGGAGEFQALDYFIKCGRNLGLDTTSEIRLRPHPSEPQGKYDAWLARNRAWNLHLDPSPSLELSIAWADMVVGCETYAMVVGLAAGRRVVSALPPHAPRCRLPMMNIIHLRDLPPINNSGSTP